MRPMNQYLEHPAEEALERFLLHQSSEQELDVVETHILACDTCVARLETLEVDIAATKLALQEVRQQQAEKAATRQPGFVEKWLSLPRLSFAAACAALVLGIAVLPEMYHPIPAADVTLVAQRGIETDQLPVDRPLHVTLDAADLNQSTVGVELVDANGSPVWNATAPVQNDRVVVNVPRIAHSGEHYFRLYSSDNQRELLREFAFNVK